MGLLLSLPVGAVLPANLEQALALVQQRISDWASSSESYAALLLEAFGGSSAGASALQQELLSGSFSLPLQLLDGASMGGALGGYTSSAPDGGERIYLNATWLAGASVAAIEAVLLEEIGHAIDHRLNGDADTPGDEGERFSALIRGLTPALSAYSENDQRLITVNGDGVLIEAAATGAIDLSDIAAGIGGFVINGQSAGDLSGLSASSAGDVNGDGLDDLIIGTRTSSPEAGTEAGRSYVVFGTTNAIAIDLSAIAQGSGGGFVINGQSAGDRSG